MWVSLMLSVAFENCHLCCVSVTYTERCYAECGCAGCRLYGLSLMLSAIYAECHYAECC